MVISFFLGSKKRDLPDKSKDWEDSKVKESNSLNSLTDEVFSDGLNSLELAKLLVNCLKSIENQVKELFAFHEKAKGFQIKVTESLEFMSEKFDDLEKKIKKKDATINQLEKNIENLVEKQKILSYDIDDLEQYWRRNCLVFHGVNESNDENTSEILTEAFSEELGV